jgi:UPF0755 protein
MIKKIVVVLILLGFVLGGGYLFLNYKMESSKSDSPVEYKFQVKKGEGVNQISNRLEKEGIISNSLYFDLYIWKEGKEAKIVTGTYTLRPNMTLPEIVDILTNGKSADSEDQKITIIEGWSIDKMAEYLAAEDVISKENFLEEAKKVAKYKDEYDFLADLDPGEDTLEGYLFPDTYLLFPNSDAEMIVTKMLDNFDQKLTEKMREDIQKSDYSIKEIIIMASIVEREVPNKDEQKMVAGIFYKRLEDKYLLQSCATINYILGTSKKQLSTEDTRIESPYNTYLNKGLPPGPISNPGISAIMAAIYPTETDYYYFLNNQETGELIFSRTLEEHNRNKLKHGL